MKFSFDKGPAVSAFVRIANHQIDRVELELNEKFQVLVSENEQIANLIFEWCQSYIKKKCPPCGFPFKNENLTAFQKKVFGELMKVPQGQTLSYKELAERSGSSRAHRAVGLCLGKNPWPLFVPCHRVINHDGSLGGFSGGLEVKKRLLAFEAGGRPVAFNIS